MNTQKIALSISITGACLLSTGAAAQVRTSTSNQSLPITRDALLPGDPNRPAWPADNATMFVVLELIGQPPHLVYRSYEIFEWDADWSPSKIHIKWWTKVAGAYFGKWTVRQYPYKVLSSGTQVRATEPVMSGYTLGYTNLATFGQDFIIDFGPYAVNDSGKEYWFEIQPLDKYKRSLAPPSHPMIIRFVSIPR